MRGRAGRDGWGNLWSQRASKDSLGLLGALRGLCAILSAESGELTKKRWARGQGMDSEERRVRHRPSRARSAPERKPIVRSDRAHAMFFLWTGVQLAEDDGHSHMTQGHSSRSKRSAYPSTSRGEHEALRQERAPGARRHGSVHTLPHGGMHRHSSTCNHTGCAHRDVAARSDTWGHAVRAHGTGVHPRPRDCSHGASSRSEDGTRDQEVSPPAGHL